MRAAARLLGLLLAFGQPAAATDYTLFRSLVIPTADPAAMRGLPAILNTPAGWLPGDAAAVVLFDPPAATELRDTLIAALLDGGAAVLELDANAARGFSADSARNPPPPTAESLLHDLAAALVALRRDAGAGLVVAIGHGLGGEAALRAADPASLAGPLGEEGPRYAASASIGPGAPAFRAGPPPAAAEGWARRAPRLCDVLAFTLGALPTPHDPDAATATAEAACRDALLAAR